MPEQQTIVLRGRELVRGALAALGLSDEAVDEGLVMASELITNALRHAHGPYELRLYHWSRLVVCEVVDGLDVLPPISDGEISSLSLEDIDSIDDPALLEGGRGLAVVHRLSQGRCGARFTEMYAVGRLSRGKAVWFAIDTHERRGER